MLGAAGDMVSGAGNIALGVLTFGQSGTLNRGLGQFDYGLSQELDIQTRDLIAGVAGVAGKVYVTARDAANVVTLGQIAALATLKNKVSGGPTNPIGAIERLIAEAPVPCYGNFNGSSWGVPNYGLQPNLRITQSDFAAYIHDQKHHDWQWLHDQYTTHPQGQWVGPLGAAYALIGTVPFAIRGAFPGH